MCKCPVCVPDSPVTQHGPFKTVAAIGIGISYGIVPAVGMYLWEMYQTPVVSAALAIK
jgi:hypothetical protein